MITKSNLPNGCDYTKDYVGISLSRQYCPRAGYKLKMYIPVLMSGIERGIPKERSTPINRASQGLLNAVSCRPTFKSHIKYANYIPVTMGNVVQNENWMDGNYYGYVKENSKFHLIFFDGRLHHGYFDTYFKFNK